MPRLFRFLLRLLPMLLVLGALFFSSGIPGEHLAPIPVTGFEAHVIAYGVLAITVFYAFGPWFGRLPGRWSTLTVIFICILYAISDEIHKSFIPGRTFEFVNIVADSIGVFVVCAIRNSRFWQDLSL